MPEDSLIDRLEMFKEGLTAQATGGSIDPDFFKSSRKLIIEHPLLKRAAPPFLHSCRNPDDFWSYIKGFSPQWAPRREHIREAFVPLFKQAETEQTSPADDGVAATLQRFNAESVHTLWRRALDRRDGDPEGAITLSRTLLETVCKHILDDGQVTYAPDSDLPKLYKETAKLLNIAPSQHSEDVFKQILGGCTAVVEGLGALRNRLSDAHGQGKKAVRPAARHAELAVNLAGTVATFLVLTFEHKVKD